MPAFALSPYSRGRAKQPKRADHDAACRAMPAPDGHVDAFLDKIDDAVLEIQAEVDSG